MSKTDEIVNAERRKITGRATLIFLAVMLLLTFFSSTINNFSLPKITYESPSSGALVKELSGAGYVEAKTVYDYYISSNMKVIDVMVEIGDHVKKGQPLLALDTTDIEKQLKDEQDKYAQLKLRLEKLLDAATPVNQKALDRAVQVAKQNMEKAQKNLEDNKSLFEAGAITSSVLEDSETALVNAELDYEIAVSNKEKTINDYTRDIESTKLDISMAERRISQLREDSAMSSVVAPCDGVVTELNFTKGMTANSSQPLYRIAETKDGYQFIATIDTEAAEYLTSGDTAEITINSLNGEIIKGNVKQIKDNLKQIGRKKDVVLDIQSEGLIGGESGVADFKKNLGSYRTLVPNSSIGQDNDGFFVYIVRERNGPLGSEFYVERITVTTDDSDNAKTAVISGISGMDKVVTNSDKPLADGSRVMLAQ